MGHPQEVLMADPIDNVPSYEFWRLACADLARKICKLLKMTNTEVTLENIRRVSGSLPRNVKECTNSEWIGRSFCAQLLLKLEDRKESNELAIYFLVDVAERSENAQMMLKESFAGILSGIQFDESDRPTIVDG
jgi:hypothetical protein